MMRRLKLLVLTTILVTVSSDPSYVSAQEEPKPLNVPPGFRVEGITGNLEWPTTFAFAPDGRVFIAEKAGRVKIWKDGVLYARPLIDIRRRGE
jgi:glucose/arabinose dehydrogenase